MNRLLDFLSNYLAHRKGLLPLVGIVLVIANLVVQTVLPDGWLAQTDLLLHLGVIVAIVGFLLAWAL
ncbi:MAG TPA: hypothetical protein VJ768_09520 [Anaerolineales bacterium]|nr:hypothetical protein [Anaerolineales bacterium]